MALADAYDNKNLQSVEKLSISYLFMFRRLSPKLPGWHLGLNKPDTIELSIAPNDISVFYAL